ncbi:MAG TPA: AAA family ATPase [Gaiellaceae bacterium]|jgi:capsular exopolysaccharide synthesis family protein|nr:AAA family ATPase [Gaiellaceae bacterium]
MGRARLDDDELPTMGMTDLGSERPARESRRGLIQEGGLPELFDALRWRWQPTALIALVFMLGATVYVESLQSQYDGQALVAVGPRPNQPTAGADTVRVIAPKYVEYVTARSTVEKVAPEIGEDPDVLEEAISARVATDTGNVTITVRLPDPERAAEAANAFARETVTFSKTDPLLVAQQVTQALPPKKPAAPPRRLLEAAALLVGILLGVVASLLLERGRPRLRSWRDLARSTGYPVVGRIPPSRALRQGPLAAFSDLRTASAFRILRANLEPQLREGAIDVIVVTSPAPADGKTTVTTLLGEALGRLGMRTLLIDGDLRRPGFARVAQIDPYPGLSEVLRGEATVTVAAQEGWAENVWILPTTHDPEAGDLLSRRLTDVLEEAREHFDLIVIDTPPLLSTDDARSIATIAKGILLVVTRGELTRSVTEAVLAIEALQAPLMGIVANRFKESSVPYYY